MTSHPKPRTESRISRSANATKQAHVWTIALAITLSFAAVPPSARGQKFSMLYSFTGGTDGSNPFGGVVRDSAGNLFGTTQYGGDLTCFSVGCGVVFKIDATGRETVLFSFPHGKNGGYGGKGAYPQGVILDASGNLYGTTYAGGTGCNCGVVFKLAPSGRQAVLHAFSGQTDGAYTNANLISDSEGNFYGTTIQGGSACDCGTIYKVDATGKETVLYSFPGDTSGATPFAGLTRDSAGNLYGTTMGGGDLSCTTFGSCGAVFKLDPSGNESVLYSFTGGNDGSTPEFSGVFRDSAGNLYGTTERGGDSVCNNPLGCGTVYKIDASGRHTVLYSFTGGNDGYYPYAGVIRDSAGNLYGTTWIGGHFGSGTVFKLDTSGKETILHTFTGGGDGAQPTAGLIMDSVGNLYGTTSSGGTFGNGTVFKIAP